VEHARSPRGVRKRGERGAPGNWAGRRAARRSRGGGKAAPYGRKPTGRGTAARSGSPAPAAGRISPVRRCGDRAHARLTGPSDSRRASCRRERSPSRARLPARPRKRGRPLTLIFPGKTRHLSTDGPDSTWPHSALVGRDDANPRGSDVIRRLIRDRRSGNPLEKGRACNARGTFSGSRGMKALLTCC